MGFQEKMLVTLANMSLEKLTTDELVAFQITICDDTASSTKRELCLNKAWFDKVKRLFDQNGGIHPAVMAAINELVAERLERQDTDGQPGKRGRRGRGRKK